MTRSLRPAAAIFGIVVLLVGFVAWTAYASAREQLASEFAQGQWYVARYTAQHFRDQYQAAGLAANLLAADGAVTADEWQVERLDFMANLFHEAQVSFLLLDGPQSVVRSHPQIPDIPPAEALEAVWDHALAHDDVEPFFFYSATGQSYLLLGRRLNDAGLSSGDGSGPRVFGVMLGLARILTPPQLAEGDGTVVLVVNRDDRNVTASSAPLTGDLSLRSILSTETPALEQMIASGKHGWEQAAQSARLSPDGLLEPHLVGMHSLRLGQRGLAVVATGPRKQLVDRYLRSILGWIAGIGVVMLLGFASFVALVVRSRAVERQEQQRSAERNSLYQISLALLSAGDLDQILSKITNGALDLFDAEGATIALLDEPSGDVLFRSVASRNPEVADLLRELRIPAGSGVIGWVIANNEAVLVNDAQTDARFVNAVDQRSGVQTMSLLCAPLQDQTGKCFGAIELVNSLEHPFPESDLVLLRSLAATAAAAVERAVWQEEQAVRERLQREMDIARTVQQGLLPHSFPEFQGFDLYGANTPAREVGGDFFDFIRISDRHLGVVVADVADKGLGAAMFMVLCRSLLYSIANREISPAKVLTELNTQILAFSGSDLFVTIFYGVLDCETRQFTFSNAGHNPPIWYQAATAELDTIELRGMALGVLDPLLVPLTEQTVTLTDGDRLVLYTDGITEAIDPVEEQFGLDRLKEVVANHPTTSADALGCQILTDLTAFVRGQAQFDDITLAVVIAGGDSEPVDWLAEARTRG